MPDSPLSRRTFLAASATTPVLLASDRIVQFVPPPDRVRIVTALVRSAVQPYKYTPEEIGNIQSQGRNVEMTVPTGDAELYRCLPEADVVFGSIDGPMLAAAKNLRWLQAIEAGMDTVLFPELVQSSVAVTNMARVYAPAISETAFAMLLSLTRGLVSNYFPQFEQRKWIAERNLVEVDGMTMGIVGMGGLGSETAKRAHLDSTCESSLPTRNPWPGQCSWIRSGNLPGLWKWSRRSMCC